MLMSVLMLKFDILNFFSQIFDILHLLMMNGAFYVEIKEYHIAQSFFTEVTELFPHLPDGFKCRAKCYMNMVIV